ncbi:protein kinase [Gemmatirosa kalamazoonensis]|uniref:Protein kinase n=2 Tax=Gemmatirosa kalamazoonensis TaxID=861299 RepID=W0RF59_9BACT|nr:protein kinase [Gemmatirosa kalamazoonensis]
MRRADERAARRRLEQDAEFVAHLLAGRERSLAGGARVFAQGPYFRGLVASQRPLHDELLDQAMEAEDLLDASWVFITDARGRLLAKSDEPGAAGTDMGGVALIAGALRGQVMSGFGVSRDSLLFQVIAMPIAVPNGTPVGVLVATNVIGEEVVRDVRATTGSDVLFYALGVDGRPHIAASSVARTTALDSALGALSAGRRPGGGLLRVGAEDFHVQGARATTAGGEAVGGWTVLRAHGAEASEVAGMRATVAAVAVVGLALALLAAWLAARQVTRPIRALATLAHRAVEGDYDPTRDGVEAVVGAADLDGEASDEIAALGAAFRAMIAELRDREALTALGARVPNEPAAASAAVAAPTDARGASAVSGVRVLRLASPARPARLAERYELQAVVGAGGTGIVYKALDDALGEIVAVKMLRPELLAADPLARERLTHEIRLARRISHRHVVRIHDIAENDGVPFLTMEFVDGPSLDALLHARGALEPRAVLAVAKQLVRALDVAHTQGVVHGDLKPANLLVAPGGVVKVTDFGVARLVRGPVGPDAARIAGAVVGTPEYMAPELLLGSAPDVRADIYAAGVVLHECLTGETPFNADTPVAFFAHKLDETPARGTPIPQGPTLAAPRGIAAALGALVAQMTAADPAGRPASARAVYAMLLRIG